MSHAPTVSLTMGVVVPTRHFYKTGLNIAAVLAVTTCLTACAGMNVPFYGKLGAPAAAPSVATTVDSVDANGVPHTAPVAVTPLDPINAPPPPNVVTSTASSDPLLVPAPSVAPKSDGSQRVPLGTLGVPAPASSPPVSIMQPPTKQQAAAPVAPVAESKPAQAPFTQPRAMMTPSTAAAAQHTTPQAAAAPVPAAPAPVAAAPVPIAAAPIEKPKAPVLRLPVGKPSTTPFPSDGLPPKGEESQETVIISSDTAKPVIEAREFVPASVAPGQNAAPQRGLGDIPMTAGEKNVVQRFETLRRLQEEALITQDEYTKRRNANIGALLPYTRDPAGMGLERSVPGTDAIMARLQALRRSFEMRAITATQHALERSMILNALLPEMPDDRTERRPPPEDVIEGAAMVGHLEALRGKNLITAAELEAEKNAIEHVLRTGLLPSQEMPSGGKKGGSKGAAAAKAKTTSSALPEADAGETEITGPVLHLASFRSEASAKQAWQDAIGNNKASLASLKSIIRRVDLGPEKGIFYRLMAGPFKSLSDAEAICIQLKQNNQFCRASADGS